MESVFTFFTEAAIPKASTQQLSSRQHHQRWAGQGYEGRAPSDKDWKRQGREGPDPSNKDAVGRATKAKRPATKNGLGTQDTAPRNNDWDRRGEDPAKST